MKRFYKLFLPAMFVASVSFAQSNYRPGYMVTTQADTVKGMIDQKDWLQNPLKFDFKDSQNKVTTYQVGLVKAFGIYGSEQFNFFRLAISYDEVDLSKLKGEYKPDFKAVDINAKVITTGPKLSLYAYTDAIKTRFIIADNNGQTVKELPHHLYIDPLTKNRVEINRFRIELNQFADSIGVNTPALSASIQRAGYFESDLRKIVDRINDKKEERKPAGAKNKAQFFAGAAVNGSQLVYSLNTDLAVDRQNHTDFFPQLNFGVNYYINPDVKRSLLRAELNLYQSNLTAISANARKEVSAFTIDFTPQFIYNVYNTDKTKFFLGTGLVLHYSFYSKNTYTVTLPQFSSVDAKDQLTPFWLAIPVKAGVVLNSKIELYGAYHLPSSVTYVTGSGADAHIRSFQFGINYFFGKK